MTNRMIRPVEIYLNTPPPDATVPRAVRLSQVTFADLAEPQSQNVAGTLFGGVLLGFIDRAAAFCAMKHAGRRWSPRASTRWSSTSPSTSASW